MRLYLVILLSFICQFGFSQVDTSKVVLEKIIYDNLWISRDHKRICIKVIVDRLKYQEGSGCMNCDPDDISLSVYDEKDQLIYLKNYPAPNDIYNYIITPSSIHLEGVGDVLIVNEFSLPSLGWDGDVTVYGFNDYGYLLPLTYPITLTNKFSDGTYLRVKEVGEQQKLWNTRNNCNNCNLAIETTNDSGNCDFHFLKYYPLNLDGIGGLPFDVEEYQPQKIPLDVRPYDRKVITEFADYLDNREITLYEKPDKSSPSKPIQLKIGSNVEFYYMVIISEERFIYLTIDGSAGYSPYWSDYSLEKLGFPGCN